MFTTHYSKQRPSAGIWWIDRLRHTPLDSMPVFVECDLRRTCWRVVSINGQYDYYDAVRSQRTLARTFDNPEAARVTVEHLVSMLGEPMYDLADYWHSLGWRHPDDLPSGTLAKITEGK